MQAEGSENSTVLKLNSEAKTKVNSTQMGIVGLPQPAKHENVKIRITDNFHEFHSKFKKMQDFRVANGGLRNMLNPHQQIHSMGEIFKAPKNSLVMHSLSNQNSQEVIGMPTPQNM